MINIGTGQWTLPLETLIVFHDVSRSASLVTRFFNLRLDNALNSKL